MKICFFGIYEPSYSRNNILLKGLKEIGVEVVECRIDSHTPWKYLKLWKDLRALRNQYDFIYAAYPSPVPAILAKIVSRKPVVADAFYSMFDSVVNDRKKFSPWHPISIKLLVLDWLSVILADIIITDTDEHKLYWSSWWGVKANKIRTVYLGINNSFFYPLPQQKREGILVHFHGYYIPLQGVLKIIEAAHICAQDSGRQIHFRLIGGGRDYNKARELAKRYDLSNVEFVNSVPLKDLNSYLGEADIVLGIFGDTDKARRVIPNKVYEGLAAKKALITMNSPAIREVFDDRDMLLVENDPTSIANGIMTLANYPARREALASHGYEKVSEYRPKYVAEMLVEVFEEYLAKRILKRG